VQTVRTIQATHERLVAAMAAHQAIEIDCNAVAELDLSLIQLVLAAKRSADKADKSLTLAAPASGKLRAALDRAGFLAAAVRGPGEAFWLKGAKAP
jgi:ABC-type transporter Mla MlaB component